ncbi:Putative membrane protein [Corynebacterium glyciniphilum AJ 3170]|uniref:Putative membrane protein n=1 Tax=Corynebacterium glyciniphilum AJ 3170 TaxID=1404245 RepID=X5EF50_9CORY|nr:hypothetical protein [Corynebacterium glyciniphilum]AHW65226.1 Putative membrane protein [Corynebacterium glyciniphilum AJ 3170]
MTIEPESPHPVRRPAVLLALVVERLPLLELGLLILGITGAAVTAWVEVFGPIGRSSGDFTTEWINDLMTWAPSTAVFISVVSDNMFPRQSWPPFASLVAGILLWIPLWMAPTGPNIGGGLLWIVGMCLAFSGVCSLIRRLLGLLLRLAVVPTNKPA